MTEGRKDDQGKPRTDLVPPGPILAASRVLAFGAQKYGVRNWENGMLAGRLYGAMLRHLFYWWGGEELDPETSESHLSHALCCLLMLHALHEQVDFDKWDDRPTMNNEPDTTVH